MLADRNSLDERNPHRSAQFRLCWIRGSCEDHHRLLRPDTKHFLSLPNPGGRSIFQPDRKPRLADMTSLVCVPAISLPVLPVETRLTRWSGSKLTGRYEYAGEPVRHY